MYNWQVNINYESDISTSKQNCGLIYYPVLVGVMLVNCAEHTFYCKQAMTNECSNKKWQRQCTGIYVGRWKWYVPKCLLNINQIQECLSHALIYSRQNIYRVLNIYITCIIEVESTRLLEHKDWKFNIIYHLYFFKIEYAVCNIRAI